MPVSVDDPFLLASFSSTTHTQHHHQHNHHAVSCTPVAKQLEESQDDEQDPGILALAIQGEGVQLFNTMDQKCILSYSAPPGYGFTGSAQILQKSARLRNVYAVIAKGTDVPAKEESKVVWMWKDDSSLASAVPVSALDSNIQDDTVKPSTAKKTVHKFDHRIYQLFVSPLLPNHVVFANAEGSLSLVTEDLKRVVSTQELYSAQPSKEKRGRKDATIQNHPSTTVWAITFSTSGSWIPSSALARNTLVVMTIVESGADKAVAVLSYINEDQRGFSTFGQVEINAAVGSSGFAFDVKSGQLSFLTATGQLMIYSFDVSQGDHVVAATETLTLPLPGYAAVGSSAVASTKSTRKGSKATAETDNKVQRVDAVALGDNYLAVAGIHQMAGKSEATLTIWDIRYGTLQAKHVISGSVNAANTTYQLALLPDSVLVMTMSTTVNTTVKSDIYLCHFYAEPMSLLGAMGRMKDTAPFLGQQGSMLAQDAYTATTTSLLTPSDVGGVVKAKDAMVDSADLEKQLTTAQAAEKKALESLNSESKTSTAPAFEAVFFDHVQQQSAEAMEDIIMSHGLDPQEVKVALAADQERKDAAHKLKQQQAEATQDMDIDAEPAANGSKSSRKEMKKAAKAARKAAKEGETEEEKKDKKERKEAKAERKAAKAEKKAVKAVKTGDATKVAEDAESGSSSESSSDDEDDDDEMVVMSSEDERNDDDQDEEPEYEVDEEQERVRREAYLHDVEEWRKMETEAIKKYQHQRRLLRAGRKPAPLPELSHHFLTTVLARCFRRLPNGQPDMTFWPGKVVEYLIENQLVGNSNPGAGQAGIALELMEREQWPLLELALRKLHDIPELDMMTMLKQVIGLNKNKDSAEKTATAASLSPVPEVAHFLNLVMTVPRNEIFMQQAVKKLTVEELSLVLEILKGWISIWDERGGIGHQNQQPDKRQLPGGLPGYGLMVDFITILMDVHFPSLILSPHLHPILKTIQSSIERETEISNQLEQALRGPLSLFNRKHRETEQRKKMAAAGGAVVSSNGVVSATGGLVADKRRRRKWEGGEGVPDYAVEIIHL